MADNVAITPGSGYTIAVDTCTVNAVSVGVPLGKIGFGTHGSFTYVSGSNPMPIQIGDGTNVATCTAGGALNVELVAGSAVVGIFELSDGTHTATVTASGALNVTVASALPAGTNLVGVVVAGHATDKIYSGTTSLAPQYAAINVSGFGDQTVVAAVATKIIKVISYTLVAAAAITVEWKSSGGTLLSGPMPLSANGGLGCGYSPVGHIETVAGEGLVLNLSVGGVTVGGHLVYILM
jgi:hypothetical protein